jgi:hypothetical protein
VTAGEVSFTEHKNVWLRVNLTRSHKTKQHLTISNIFLSSLQHYHKTIVSLSLKENFVCCL